MPYAGQEESVLSNIPCSYWWTGMDSHRDINRLREIHIAQRNYLLNHSLF